MTSAHFSAQHILFLANHVYLKTPGWPIEQVWSNQRICRKEVKILFTVVHYIQKRFVWIQPVEASGSIYIFNCYSTQFSLFNRINSLIEDIDWRYTDNMFFCLLVRDAYQHPKEKRLIWWRLSQVDEFDRRNSSWAAGEPWSPEALRSCPEGRPARGRELQVSWQTCHSIFNHWIVLIENEWLHLLIFSQAWQAGQSDPLLPAHVFWWKRWHSSWLTRSVLWYSHTHSTRMIYGAYVRL